MSEREVRFEMLRPPQLREELERCRLVFLPVGMDPLNAELCAREACRKLGKGVIMPIHYTDFSIVDGPGFSEKPDPDRVVRTDPRDATVAMYVSGAAQALKEKGL